MEMVGKTLNRDERNSHVVPFLRYLDQASLVARHAPQTIIPGNENKEDPTKSRRIVCAGMIQPNFTGVKQ